MLPKHPGYPSGGEFANDKGQQNFTHDQSLRDAAASGNANIVRWHRVPPEHIDEAPSLEILMRERHIMERNGVVIGTVIVSVIVLVGGMVCSVAGASDFQSA
jgi:hypothetical protein